MPQFKYCIQKPISKTSPNDTNGIIEVYSNTEFTSLENELEGVFSFTFFHDTNKDNGFYLDTHTFKKSDVYYGIQYYLSMIHDISGTHPFQKWGVVLYTDKCTFKRLHKYLPYHLFSRLIVAVVYWPYYATRRNSIESSILLCMRYHAIELFPKQIICIRDADTIFDGFLFEEKNGIYTPKVSVSENAQLLRNWETEFLSSWIEVLHHPKCPITKPYCIGSAIGYYQPWHSDIPFPTDFTKNAAKHPAIKHLFPKRGRKGFKFNSSTGVYGGFVNIGARRPGLEHGWDACVKFLLQRYYMVLDTDGERIINDTWSDELSGYVSGKDEKLLLFGILPLILEHTQFFYLDYEPNRAPKIKVDADSTMPEQFKTYPLMQKGYIANALRYRDARSGSLAHKLLYDRFATIMHKYKHFLQELDLNMVNERIADIFKSSEKEYFLPKVSPYPLKVILNDRKRGSTAHKRRGHITKTRKR